MTPYRYLPPLLVLLACSPRAYYRTHESFTAPPEEIREQKLFEEGTGPTESLEETPAEPTADVNYERFKVAFEEELEKLQVANNKTNRAEYEERWAAAEKTLAKNAFVLKKSSPLFAGKTAFETDSEYRLRRWQGVQRLGELRKETFSNLREEEERWKSTGTIIDATLSMGASDYASEVGNWTYQIRGEWRGQTLIGQGEWEVDSKTALVWSNQHPDGTITGKGTVLWTSNGTPVLAKFKSGTQTWYPTYPFASGALPTEAGWACLPQGLFAANSSTMPWGNTAVTPPELPKYNGATTLIQQGANGTIVAFKNIPSRGASTGGASKMEAPLHLLIENEDFEFSGWKEVHTMDIAGNGREVAISGGKHVPSGALGYHLWACAVSDPITGEMTELGRDGNRVDMDEFALSDAISIHPDGGLACLTSVHNRPNSVEGIYQWNAVGEPAKRSASVGSWSAFNTASNDGSHLALFNAEGQVELCTFESTPRTLANWTCECEALLATTPSSNGLFVATLEIPSTTPNKAMAHLRLRSAIDGEVIWSSSAFNMPGTKAVTMGHELTPKYLDIRGRECVVTGLENDGVARFLLPADFGER